MRYFTRQENGIVFRANGETVVVSPWGRDSLRVRAVQMADVRDDRFALLEPCQDDHEVEITLDDERAVLQNGRITEQGTHRELLEKRGYYWQTYCLQYSISMKEAM